MKTAKSCMNCGTSGCDYKDTRVCASSGNHSLWTPETPREKEIWLVLDETGEPIHCASWPSACHEHINDAINEHQIEGAEKWTVRQAKLSPNAELTGDALARRPG